MAMNLSKTQIDKLGERLKKGDIIEDDLRLLDAYRRSFSDSYEFVVGAIRKELGLEPTGRPAKSTTSISDKLRRESIRLTQIQDIAGCRLIVPDISNQEEIVQSLSRLFERALIIDRRQKPSHGYRAVHIIATHLDKVVEIQVRTEFEHLWAEFSEKLADIEDPAIKYGGGQPGTQFLLTFFSLTVGFVEAIEIELRSYQKKVSVQGRLADDEQAFGNTQENVKALRQQLFGIFRRAMEGLENPEEGM